ncbi:MAG: AAA family ATPase [Candidatus Methylacidiphilales bacterium]|nr:AAA family ATPase [Candidatus Methylacidiphilales bacterium]
MASKTKPKSSDEVSAPASTAELQRPAAEILYAEELARLSSEDIAKPRPPGWRMTPQSVLQFILGNEKAGLKAKFVGRRAMLERCIVALATNRGLMLIGEPGTAKSWLSELLSAAISGDSTLTIQGSAGTTDDAIKYSWNYALLLSEGPGENSLVPAPLHRGMQRGQIVRFEEITRCPVEIQDTLLSILSDRVMLVPELKGEGRTLYAAHGFNVIATANTRDRGVNEMSAALKRRFNFETVPPIEHFEDEMSLVMQETTRLLKRASVSAELPPDICEVLVTTFRDLRSAKTREGKALEPLTTAMSTAEAVSTAFAAGLHASYFGNQHITPEHLALHVAATALKDAPDDLKKVRHYFNHVAKDRNTPIWQSFYEARKMLD